VKRSFPPSFVLRLGQVSDRSISFLEVCAFPPIRQKDANGWGTEVMQGHTISDLVDVGHCCVEAVECGVVAALPFG
jgi:hypothetical protein